MRRHTSRSVAPSHAALLSLFVILSTFPKTLAQEQQQPNPCYRWSGQMAIANAKGSSGDTLYYYGGQAITSASSTVGNWTNALVSIDLSTEWNTGTPPISLVEAATSNYSDPPAVSLGTLWPSSDGSTLYQYGGQFSDSPVVPSVPAQQVFAYEIEKGEWSTVETTGDNVGRTAEGSATIVPGLGTDGDNVGFYFSGHQDFLTTQGWSNQVARIYLNSMVEFDLGSKSMRNITSYSGSASTSNSSTPLSAPLNRGDGTLTYVPNLGTDKKGILVSIGGATDERYVQNSVLDVYDIGAGGWTRQSTLGDTLDPRVNHCAVRGTAVVNGIEMHHIFIYGGQRLNQSDRDSAMWILTIQESAYTWTLVSNALPGSPAGRAGHQCVLSGDQLLVVGGLTSSELLCDQPGIYVYNTTSSAWANQFRPNTQFSTPSIVANITGGLGTSDPDSNSNNNGSGKDTSGGSKSNNLGAIIGGVVGGVVALLLLALLVFLLLRRKKRKEANEKPLQSHHGLASRSDSGSSFSRFGPSFPYEKRPASGSFRGAALNNRRFSDSAASDTVEEDVLGMEAAFTNVGLVPKQALRVVNADPD
ncbi:uncharacterized protein JCM6883_003397 [Sporobolomyces salmoneus]|uniref:uncharacterized protein n=1 Tax=Sporobolomyces salmoneus TaxID=183962 RepID=UPI00317D3F2B